MDLSDAPINFSPHEDIAAALNSLNAIADLDPMLLDENDKEIVQQIRTMAISIVYTGLREIYEQNFYSQDNSSETRKREGARDCVDRREQDGN